MKERPILFSSEMARAILEGRKTQTRRVIKPQPELVDLISRNIIPYNGSPEFLASNIKCPCGAVGDRLWVRERHQLLRPFTGDIENDLTKFDVNYYATDNERYRDKEKWRPSIHMPRWASRITLEITGVRVERLQDITNNDALDEGTPDLRTIENGWDMRRCFQELWEQINGVGSWAENPWVWVIEFKKA